MKLIQRSTLAFCCSLLFLWVPVAFALHYCEDLVDNLFEVTSSYLEPGVPENYLFIPDQNLIKLLYAFDSIVDPSAPRHQRGSYKKGFSSNVTLSWARGLSPKYQVFHGESRSLHFGVKHPLAKNPGIPCCGSFAISCLGDRCTRLIRDITDCWNWKDEEKTATKPKNLQGLFISGSLLQPIVVRLPWNKNYTVFDAQQTLKSLINNQATVPYEWEAIDITVPSFLSEITFVTKNKIPIVAPLPKPVRRTQAEYYPAQRAREYFKAAVDFFIIGKKMGRDRLFFHDIPKASLAAVAKMDEKNVQLSAAPVSASREASVNNHGGEA